MYRPPYPLTPAQLQALKEQQRLEQLRLNQLIAAALRSTPPLAPLPSCPAAPVTPQPPDRSATHGRRRDAVSGHFVTPSYAAAHPRTTEVDHMRTPTIRSGPTRFVFQRTDTGQYVTEDFARRYPHLTVRTRVPLPQR